MGLDPLMAMIQPMDSAIGHCEMRNAIQEEGIETVTIKVQRCNCRHCYRSGLASFKRARQALAIKITSDKDQTAFALFLFLPRPLMITLEDHVNTLNDIAVCIILDRDDALEAQNIRTFGLGDLFQPGEEALRFHIAAAQ